MTSSDMLIIASHEGFGTVHIDKLLPSLIKMGCKIKFVGWDRHKKLPRHFERNSVSYRMIFRNWGYANKSLALALPLWMLRALFYLLRRRSNIIMAIDFDSGLSAALAGLITGVPFIYNIRDNFAMRTTLPRVLRPVIAWLDEWVIKRASQIIVPDESRITATDPKIRNKFSVIYNCALDIKPGCISNNGRPFTIYAMGYLMKARGIGLLLAIADRLPEIRVVLAGDVHEKDLKEQILSTPNVVYRGKLSQVDALGLCFESDVIFAFYDPISEINRKAASNKWFDAMMSGKPILANSEILKGDWIKEQDIGYLCPYGDVDALVKTIERIRSHPDEAKNKGQNGRRLYDSGYSWTVMEKRLENLIAN